MQILTTLSQNEAHFMTGINISSIIMLLALIVGIVLIFYIKKFKNNKCLKIGCVLCLVLFGISLYNSSIANPQAESTCYYHHYEEQYRKAPNSTKYFNIKGIDKSKGAFTAFNSAIVYAPHNQKLHNWNIWYDI